MPWFDDRLIWEWGESPRLSRSCESPFRGANTDVTEILGKTFASDDKSEYLPGNNKTAQRLWG